MRCVFLKAFDRNLERTTALPTTKTATAPPRGFLLQQASWGWGALASVLAPADCRACGGPLLEANATGVCLACFTGVQPERGALCVRCGERLAWEEARGAGFTAVGTAACEACFAAPPVFARATAFGAYDATLRTLIRLHKFEHVVSLARPLGERLTPVLAEAAGAAAVSAGGGAVRVRVIAVPLFGRRRPFNQSVQIAHEAVRAIRRTQPELPLEEAHASLRRLRATEAQSHLTPAQRRDNVRGAFAVCGDVSGWSVLLVDDVYTTGATAAECSRVLLRAGAREVRVVTLARTQKETVSGWNVPPG